MREYILDTNIFIRYFIQDNPPQLKKARNIFDTIEKNQIRGFVSILVVDEIIWVLENYYKLSKLKYLPQLIELLALKDVRIIEFSKDMLLSILKRMQNVNIDFTDLYLFYISGEKNILTFDKGLKKIT